jgi:hypothetical protein
LQAIPRSRVADAELFFSIRVRGRHVVTATAKGAYLPAGKSARTGDLLAIRQMLWLTEYFTIQLMRVMYLHACAVGLLVEWWTVKIAASRYTGLWVA